MQIALLTLPVLAAGSALSEETVTFDKLGLTLAAPALEEVEYTDKVPKKIRESDDDADAFDQRRLALWTGKLGESEAQVGFHLYPGSVFINEPADVVSWAIRELRDRDGSYRDTELSYEEGAFGYAPFVQIAEGEVHDKEGAVIGVQFLVGGLLQHESYVLHARIVPAPGKKERKALLKYLKGAIEYDGPKRDRDWTLDEVRERWLRDTPEDLHEDFLFKLTKPGYIKKAIVRTDNYIILTNSSSGKLFAKKMEENYDEIAKVFPFEEVKGMRLMPVFLFRTRGQYNEFYAKIADTTTQAANRTKGHAWRDYYATWYESPNDPVHIHECTHQIFDNRMALSGAGSWFQEGVAEYIETRDSDRNVAARQVKNGEHVPLPEFVKLRSLVYSSEDSVKGGAGAAAADAYKQAALLIEFLRESKFGKGKFEDFLYSVGRLPYSDKPAIEAEVMRIYGTDLAGIDEEWRKYCKKR